MASSRRSTLLKRLSDRMVTGDGEEGMGPSRMGNRPKACKGSVGRKNRPRSVSIHWSVEADPRRAGTLEHGVFGGGGGLGQAMFELWKCCSKGLSLQCSI